MAPSDSLVQRFLWKNRKNGIFEALFQLVNDIVEMREMAHSICLMKLYQITMRKKFRLFVSDYLQVPLRVRQFFCFWKLSVPLNNCANFFWRSDKPERLYWTSKLSIWSYFGIRLCSRPLKHEDPWKSGPKNGGEYVT